MSTINPQCAYAARITVVSLSVYVCVSVCLSDTALTATYSSGQYKVNDPFSLQGCVKRSKNDHGTIRY